MHKKSQIQSYGFHGNFKSLMLYCTCTKNKHVMKHHISYVKESKWLQLQF